MKEVKIVIIIVIVIILFSNILILANEEKINSAVYDSINNLSEVRVIIQIDPTNSSFKQKLSENELNNNRDKIVKEIKEDIGNNDVKNKFGNLVSAKITKEDLEKLEENPEIKSVKIDRPIKAFLQDSVPLINATLVWPIQALNKNLTGLYETACIIDSGIYNHTDFSTNIIGTHCFCSTKEGASSNCCPNGNSEDTNATDNNGHGTHVAGIFAASSSIKGVAIGSKIVAVKILNSSGDGYGSDLKLALDWCISNADTYNISVISLSLGGGSYTGYCDNIDDSENITGSIDNAVSRNISVVVAAGNSASTTSISSPACIRNAIAVGATTKADAIWVSSNRNNITDLLQEF